MQNLKKKLHLKNNIKQDYRKRITKHSDPCKEEKGKWMSDKLKDDAKKCKDVN